MQNNAVAQTNHSKIYIKYLKNFRAIEYNLMGHSLSVIAFGVFNYATNPKRDERLGVIESGFEWNGVRHILCFEIDESLKAHGKNIIFAEADRREGIAERNEVLYDASCHVKNHIPFSLEQYKYLCTSAWKASRGGYKIGIHCEAGQGRTGAALLAIKLFEYRLNMSDFAELNEGELIDKALESCEPPNRKYIEIKDEQRQSLANLINELAQQRTIESLFSWLEQDMYYQEKETVYPEMPYSEGEDANAPLSLKIQNSLHVAGSKTSLTSNMSSVESKPKFIDSNSIVMPADARSVAMTRENEDCQKLNHQPSFDDSSTLQVTMSNNSTQKNSNRVNIPFSQQEEVNNLPNPTRNGIGSQRLAEHHTPKRPPSWYSWCRSLSLMCGFHGGDVTRTIIPLNNDASTMSMENIKKYDATPDPTAGFIRNSQRQEDERHRHQQDENNSGVRIASEVHATFYQNPSPRRP